MAQQGAGVNSLQAVRRLFEAVCDLPAEQQAPALHGLTDDPALRREVEALLAAQTEALGRALRPLGELMASLPETELAEGESLGQWRLVERLASGGMGTVFVAERADGLYRQRVAVKLLRGRPDPAVAERLAAERQILASLQHPGIARLYDGGTTPAGQPYLVMEFVAGLPLDRYLARHRPGLEERLVLFLRICRAVAHAHRQLVVHCDLKPGNVLVREGGHPSLLDFGIARAIAAEGDDGLRYCTPAYAAPEQLRGERVGVAADVFGLGMMLGELLTDAPPGRGPDDVDRPPPPPSQRAGALPWARRLHGDLDAITMRATALDPAARYPGVDALVDDLERWQRREPVAARGGGAAYRARRWMQRHWRGGTVAAAMAIAALVFTWRLAEERDRAERAAATARQVSELLVGAFDAADPRRTAGSHEMSAREVLDASARRIDDELSASPDIAAELRLVLGRAYRSLGQPRQAEALLRAAAAGFSSEGLDQPAQAASAWSQLATLLANDRRGDEAVAAAREAQRLRGPRPTPAEQADTLNSLGIALTAKGDLPAAMVALRDALTLRRAEGAAGAAAVVATLNNLGRAQRLHGDAAASEASHREALSLAQSLGPVGQPMAQLSLDGIARALLMAGRRDEAWPVFERSLALAAGLYGPQSNAVAGAHNELANLLHDLGRWDDAERHYRASLDIEAAVSGQDSPRYAVVLNNLGALAEDRGDPAAAEAYFRQSLAIREAALPAGDTSVLRGQLNLARLLLRTGRLDAAGALLDALQSSGLATGHEALRTRLLIAELRLRRGAPDQAEALLADLALDDSPGHRPLQITRELLLADIAARRGDAAAARAGRERALAAQAALTGADSPAARRIQALLAPAAEPPPAP